MGGHPALRVTLGGDFDGVFTALVRGGQIAGIYYVRTRTSSPASTTEISRARR